VSRKDALIVIPNYNGEARLPECLASVLGQTGFDLDVVVVDNASQDNSLALLRRDFPGVRVLANSENLGFGTALNQGVRSAGSGYGLYVFLNNDTQVEPGWLAGLVEAMRREPRMGICNSLVVNRANGRVDSAGGDLINLYLGILGGHAAEQDPALLGAEPFEVFYADACSMAVRPELFSELGGFEQGYFMYYEEVELCWRARLLGAAIYCAPASRVLHAKGSTPKTKALSLRILGGMDRNLVATYLRLLGPARLAWVLPVLLLSRLASSLIYLPVSPRAFWARLGGLAQALAGLPGNLRRRRQVQASRRVSDKALLASAGPGIYSLRPILGLIVYRVRDIRDWYSGRGRR
jgi:GT2 family glycosyltransferase